MDLLQLEHFLAVVEERSFTRAAERVFRTQPAISQSVKKLEDEIGAPLFARVLHEVTLTAEGKVLVDYARRMLQLRDEAVRQIGGVKYLDAGTLSIAAHETAAVYLLARPLKWYFEKFPGVKVTVCRSRLDEIPRQILDRDVDVGFVKDEPIFHGLESVQVHEDETILIASPRHPLRSRLDVRIRDLGCEQFVLHHLCSSTEQKILRLFKQHNTQCRIAAEVWSFENIKAFVEQDVGIAIVPKITVLQELQDGCLVHIPVKELDIPRRTFMVFRDQGYLSSAARELIHAVKAFAASKWSTVAPIGGPAEPKVAFANTNRRRSAS